MLLSWAPVQIILQFTWSGDNWSYLPITFGMHQRVSFMNQFIECWTLATKILLSNGQHFWTILEWKLSRHIVWSSRFCMIIVANAEISLEMNKKLVVRIEWWCASLKSISTRILGQGLHQTDQHEKLFVNAMLKSGNETI